MTTRRASVAGPGEPTGAGRRPPLVLRICRRILAKAVRGDGERGSDWGEAILRELDEAPGPLAAIRWTASGGFVALRERRGRLRSPASPAAASASAPRLSRRVVGAAAAVIAGALAINQFALSMVYIPSGSMEPTLRIGDRILLDKASLRLFDLGPGDIVAFHRTERPGTRTTMAKRVIGLEGDHIECRDGNVLRDGSAIDEPYLEEAVRTECAPVTVPEDSLYVLGDQRSVSRDSRHFGVIKREDVVGRLVVAVWPPRRLTRAGPDHRRTARTARSRKCRPAGSHTGGTRVAPTCCSR